MKSAIPITEKYIHKFYKAISSNTHKGIQGHALLIGGSYGKIGAIVLASKAALKSGCGLVTAFVPECGYTILQISNPEVMTIMDECKKYISKINFDIKPQAIGIGPGMGQEQPTQKGFYDFLKVNKVPLVIDADALNILAENRPWFKFVPSQAILTPHQKELERLIGKWSSENEKFERTIDFSKEHNVVLVMKGAPTYIVYKDDIFENATGNAALATAGSGDVLTGIITSLLAQGYLPIEAAQFGVFLHGLTADYALPETSYQSFIASDIIRYLGKAFLSFDIK